jgi:hypothetical protein
MPDPVVIDLGDGKPRLLKYGAAAIGDLEEEHFGGRSIWTVLARNQATFKLTVGLLWAGLRWKDKQLTYEKAGALVDAFSEATGKDHTALLPNLMEGLFASNLVRRAKAKEEENDPNGPTAKENGKTSPSPNGSGESAPHSAATTDELLTKSAPSSLESST